jgi:hypothetical protein
LVLLLTKPAETITLTATVAPKEVVSGGAATLILSYDNQSKTPLTDVGLTVSFPPHFVPDPTDAGSPWSSSSRFSLADLAPGENGVLKIRGVMYGDVLGEQRFVSTLSFQQGQGLLPQKIRREHVFSPTRSALSLELLLPSTLFQGEQVTAELRATNNGTVDLPAILIEPVWPEGFSLVQGNPDPSAGWFELERLKAGEASTVTFSGLLPKGDQASFVFRPSFLVGRERFAQQPIAQTAWLSPSPLAMNYTFSQSILTPGEPLTLDLFFQNVGESTIEQIIFSAASPSPFVSAESAFSSTGAMGLSPGTSGLATLAIPILSSVPLSLLSTSKPPTATIRITASYNIPENDQKSSRFLLGEQTFRITTPLTLRSFGRFSATSGDQIGRGPLPPVVGEETTYWMVLEISGTINDLSGVMLRAPLTERARFTGRQSVSVGGPLSYDPASHELVWRLDSLPSSIAPGAGVVSAAFEVGFTPGAEDVGTSPLLLLRPAITAHDQFTGAFVSAAGEPVSTDLAGDAMAEGLGVVRPSP